MKRNLHKNSFLTYNIILHLAKSSGFYPGLELLNTLTVCRQTTQFYFRRRGWTASLYTFLKSTPSLFLTTNKGGITHLQKNPNLTPTLLTVVGPQLSKEFSSADLNKVLPLLLLSASFQTFRAQVTEVYKVVIQLYLYSLFVRK